MILAIYEEIEDLACKRQRVGGNYQFMDTIQNNEVDNMVQHPPIIEARGDVEILVNPRCSKVSGSIEKCLLQCQIVSTEIMTIYMEEEGPSSVVENQTNLYVSSAITLANITSKYRSMPYAGLLKVD